MRFKTTLFVMLFVVALDQTTKHFLKEANFLLVPGLLRLQGVFNTGAAFGVLKGRPGLLVALSVPALAAAFLFLYRRRPQGTLALGVSFLVGGAAGNLLDRVFRGGVIDFIVWVPISFPAFNFADIAITAGAALTAWSLLRHAKGEFS